MITTVGNQDMEQGGVIGYRARTGLDDSVVNKISKMLSHYQMSTISVCTTDCNAEEAPQVFDINEGPKRESSWKRWSCHR
jgi:hypothetical protein